MLAIHKKSTHSLVHFCKEKDAFYANIPKSLKEDLKLNLLQEQGFICAYCMARINKDTMHIEHWYPQKPHDIEPQSHAEKEAQRRSGIDYKNLLAVCHGGTKHTHKLQHCDTYKKNALLTYNPADPSHELKLCIGYSKSTGQIFSHDIVFNEELSSILNLNVHQLQLNRKSVINAVNKSLSKLGKTATASVIAKKLEHWQTRNSQDQLQPFAGVAIHMLQRRLSSLTS